MRLLGAAWRRAMAHPHLRLGALASVVCAAAALLLPWEAVRLVFAAPMALLLPGYAIAAAAFVARPPARPLLLPLSLGLSLMTLPLGAVLLNYAPGGISPLSWALLLIVVTLAGCLVAGYRRPGRARWPLPVSLPAVNPPQLAVAGLGVALAVAAIAVAFTTLPAKNVIGYSELWVLPRADGDGVRVGVASQEQRGGDFRVRVSFDHGRAKVERTLRLEPGEERVFSLDTPDEVRDGEIAVTATLAFQDRPGDIYRRVAGFLPGPGSEG